MTDQLNISTRVRITLVNEDAEERTGMGLGAATLLEKVVELGSLNAAAKSMGMAYTKAWKLIRACEASLGCELLVRDGARGSSLTENGARLLAAYRTTADEVTAYAAERFSANLNG